MKNTKSSYQITPEEFPRIFGGILSQADFDTTKPNPRNISKIAVGIEQYLSHKKKEAANHD